MKCFGRKRTMVETAGSCATIAVIHLEGNRHLGHLTLRIPMDEMSTLSSNLIIRPGRYRYEFFALERVETIDVRRYRNDKRFQQVRPSWPGHSALRACMGSTEAARRAGIRHAITAANSSRNATDKKTEKSSLPIPKRVLCIPRPTK